MATNTAKEAPVGDQVPADGDAKGKETQDKDKVEEVASWAKALIRSQSKELAFALNAGIWNRMSVVFHVCRACALNAAPL